MRTYQALPAPSPCRQSLAPQTWGCPPAPEAKVIHLRLVDEKNTTRETNRQTDRQTKRQTGRQAGRQTKRNGEGHWKERYKNQRINELLNIDLFVCGGPSSYSTEIFALYKGHPLLLFDIFMPLCNYSVRTKLVHFPLSHYPIIIITE